MDTDQPPTGSKDRALNRRGVDVLSIGADPLLLFSRQEILVKSGYSVLTRPAAEALEQTAPQARIAMFCHTLSRDIRDRLLTHFRHVSPATRMMQLVSAWDPPYLDGWDATVDSLGGPGVLLDAVANVLR